MYYALCSLLVLLASQITLHPFCNAFCQLFACAWYFYLGTIGNLDDFSTLSFCCSIWLARIYASKMYHLWLEVAASKFAMTLNREFAWIFRLVFLQLFLHFRHIKFHYTGYSAVLLPTLRWSNIIWPTFFGCPSSSLPSNAFVVFDFPRLLVVFPFHHFKQFVFSLLMFVSACIQNIIALPLLCFICYTKFVLAVLFCVIGMCRNTLGSCSTLSGHHHYAFVVQISWTSLS